MSFNFSGPTRPGIGDGLSVNKTVSTTIRNITNAPTQPGPSKDFNMSGYSIRLSTLASETQLQVNTTTFNSSMILPSGEVSTPATPSLIPRTFSVASVGEDNAWTTTAHVVLAVETPEVEEKVPDIIILGPSVPVVLIFILVVAGIAWWNYKFNSEELNR